MTAVIINNISITVITIVVVCTGLSGKEPHRRVDIIGGVVISRNLGGEMVSMLTLE